MNSKRKFAYGRIPTRARHQVSIPLIAVASFSFDKPLEQPDDWSASTFFKIATPSAFRQLFRRRARTLRNGRPIFSN